MGQRRGEATMLARLDDRTLNHPELRMPRAVMGPAQPAPYASVPLCTADRLRIDHGSPAPGALERTIAEAAALLAAADAATIDEAIVECFAQMARLLVLTRVQLWTEIGREGALPSQEWPNAADDASLNLTALPFLKTPLVQRQAVWFGSLDDVPSLD